MFGIFRRFRVFRESQQVTSHSDSDHASRNNDESDVGLLDPLGNVQVEDENNLIADHTDSDTLVLPACDLSESSAPVIDDHHGVSSRERASRRSRRYRHHRSRHRVCRCKRKETNFLAAMCSMVVIVLVCTALAESEWFSMTGGRCRNLREPRQVMTNLGVKWFFYQGYFALNPGDWKPPPGTGPPAESPQTVYFYGTAEYDVLVDCVTPASVFVMKCVILNCFLAIIFSVVALMLDLSGPTHHLLRVMRSNAVFSLISVCICVTINILSYVITEQLRALFEEYPYAPGVKIDVQFSLSFYLVTAAGVAAVVGVACNLLRRPAANDRGRRCSSSERCRLDGLGSGDVPDICSQLSFPPPPPPYTP